MKLTLSLTSKEIIEIIEDYIRKGDYAYKFKEWNNLIDPEGMTLSYFEEEELK